MRFLRGFLMCVGLIVPSLIAFFLLNIGVHRLLGPTAEQREALATMEVARTSPRAGTNAFATLWLMTYDVPDADIERIAAQDVREARVRVAAGRSLENLVPGDRARLALPEASNPALCEEREPGCLARVRSHREAARALVAGNTRMLERTRRLEDSDYYRIELPLTFDTPLPAPGPSQRLRLTALALAWDEGRREDALAQLCANIGAWRRLRRGTNSLVFSMIAASFSNGGIHLLADMLSEFPADSDLPAQCAAAFAPVDRSDISMCGEAAGEFSALAEVGALIANEKRRKAASPGRVFAFDILMPLVHSDRQYEAWMSTSYAEACSVSVTGPALTDKPFVSRSPEIPLLACASAIADCIIADVGATPFDRYHKRLLDMAARLRLVSTLLWLRDTRDDPRPLAERFAARPAHLRSGTRASGIGEDGRSLWVENLDPQKFGERTSLALAPSMESPP